MWTTRASDWPRPYAAPRTEDRRIVERPQIDRGYSRRPLDVAVLWEEEQPSNGPGTLWRRPEWYLTSNSRVVGPRDDVSSPYNTTMSQRPSTKEKESSNNPQEESVHLTSTQPISNPLTSPSYLFKLFLAFIFGAVTYNFFTRDLLSPRKFRERSDVTSLPEAYAICTDEGRVYTVDTRQPTAQCLLVRKDRLHKVGSRGECRCGVNKLRSRRLKP